MTRTAAAEARHVGLPSHRCRLPGRRRKHRGTYRAPSENRRPGRARLPFFRHLLTLGAPHQPELRYVRLLHRRPPASGNTATFAGWTTDPGRDAR